jgi:hypothetical protein
MKHKYPGGNRNRWFGSGRFQKCRLPDSGAHKNKNYISGGKWIWRQLPAFFPDRLHVICLKSMFAFVASKSLLVRPVKRSVIQDRGKAKIREKVAVAVQVILIRKRKQLFRFAGEAALVIQPEIVPLPVFLVEVFAAVLLQGLSGIIEGRDSPPGAGKYHSVPL